MTIKNTLAGLAAFLCIGLAGPASADVLSGEVYQVGNGDVYIMMSDSTVARVPLETAQFRLNGEPVSAERLTVGQHVTVDYAPVYGFQRYYHTSSELEGPETVYIIQDIDPDDISVLEWDGRLYRVER